MDGLREGGMVGGRDGRRERERGTESRREMKNVCVCVCVCLGKEETLKKVPRCSSRGARARAHTHLHYEALRAMCVQHTQHAVLVFASCFHYASCPTPPH